ncbi:putative Zn-dependent protease [Clostridium sp. CAG:411]|nr:zinc metallopeptidase [Lachnospiraceae bacterium]CDE44075.1 putative Zn-dependent protease [Clostridium sp. CAG:411]
MFYRYYFDPTYMLVIIGLLLTLMASALVKSTYAKYKKVHSMSGMTGAQVAERILHQAGIYDVQIQHIAGDLTDNYNPKTKILSLSDAVYNNTSVAAIGVAAHECGHAIQHAKEYAPLNLRSAMVPVVNICSTLTWPAIFLGIILSWNQALITLGILFFSAAVLFSLVTLPVEFDASHRALKILGGTGMLTQNEVGKARKVLTAAALTYVASAAAMILQLLRLILLFGGDRDR